MTPTEIQEEIIEEFELLSEDTELTLRYLMEHGSSLSRLTAEEKVPAHLVPGCLAQVWLLAQASDQCLHLRAQSDAAITQGLVSLLVRCFDKQPLEAVLGTALFFPQRIGMSHFIGTQRSGGFANMWQKIQIEASKLHQNHV